jgi:hypothetical protein
MRPRAASSGSTSAPATKNIARYEIGDEAHETGRDHPSRRGGALIASEALGKHCVADQAEADGSNCQPQEAAGDPLEHQGG